MDEAPAKRQKKPSKSPENLVRTWKAFICVCAVHCQTRPENVARSERCLSSKVTDELCSPGATWLE